MSEGQGPTIAEITKLLMGALEDPEFMAEVEKRHKEVETALAVDGTFVDPATGARITHKEDGGFTLEIPEPPRKEE